jgi:hypothetical protein
MKFAFTYGSGTTLEQMVAFETAGRLWSSYLSDNVTVNIHVELSRTLPTSVAGGALMGIEVDKPYATWRDRLAADRKSADDQTLHQNLPSNTDSFTAWVNEIGPNGMTSNKLEQSSNTLNLSRANAKALGIRDGQDSGLDGYILMNDQLASLGFTWNYNLDGTPAANSIDFFSVALHEIGHVLGFYSGVDASGWNLTPIAELDDDDDDDDGNSGDSTDLDPRGPLKNATSLDMVRFSNEDKLDLVVGGSPFFSKNGGTTREADYATGVNLDLGGDGYQASHWKSSGGKLGIMEPDINLGTRRSVTKLDRQALDVIGWDLDAVSADLPALQVQAKQALADRLNITVVQLEADPALVQKLTEDRSQDVALMVEQSQIYEWRRSRSGRSTGWWHEINPAAVTSNATLELSTDQTEVLAGVDSLTGLTNEATTGLTDNYLIASSSHQGNVDTGSNTLTLESDAVLSTSLSSPLTTSSSLGTAPRLTTMDALAPNYLIGSELLGLEVVSSMF